MPSKIWINPKCPICGGDVYFPKKGIIPNAEYVQTKRGLRRLFHTKCYGDWYD